MDDSTAVAWLAGAIKQAARSSKFCVTGPLPADPGLSVDGLGAVKFPFARGVGKKLVRLCRVAPYGKGTETLVDREVRNTFELDPEQFRLGDAWNTAVDGLMQPVAKELGLPPGRLEARLYKLLAYEKGGFFLPHRDSEKHDRMVASLIVALPNPFDGGELIVRHGAGDLRVKFTEAATGKTPAYAAFYADCEHEVRQVTGGVRVCLAYNLVLNPGAAVSAGTAPASRTDALADAVRSWFAKQPGEPLVFALGHHYTERGLSLDLLKGADRRLAEMVVATANNTDCLAHLAQVTRHLMQSADDGAFDHGRSRSRQPGRIVIGETYEDELSGDQWSDPDGGKQPWGAIPFDLSAIVSAEPVNDWIPTTEDYEGYTGNAGNTLDRWYHRSAIVIWPRERHFDVIAGAGMTSSIPLFCAMAAKLAKTPKKRLTDALADAIRFARAIIGRWLRLHHHSRREETASRQNSPAGDFRDHLPLLHDRDTIGLFLTKLADVDHSLRLEKLVLAACREFGPGAVADELKTLMTAKFDSFGRPEIPFRDVEWLSAFSCDQPAGADKSALARELCGIAVQRFCEPFPPNHRPATKWDPFVSEKSLPLLVKALVAVGDKDGLSRVMRFVKDAPEHFTLDECQVPALTLLIPWSKKSFGKVDSQLVSWLADVRRRLESATARRPTPPGDWTRPAELGCDCPQCGQLKSFLEDPANKSGRIAAREDLRRHLIGVIDRRQCDVTHTLDRSTSPQALILTKTQGSYERSVRRHESDLRLLKSLPAARDISPGGA